jgi:hypothetical protein
MRVPHHIFVIVATLVGCVHRNEQRPPAARHEATIAVGQEWSDARGTATRAGYPLHDASGLAMEPTPDGFYIDLPGGRGLLVFRNPRTNRVRALKWVENWDGPKASRIEHDVESFDVPPPDPTAPTR